jgi:phosphate transport system permease protein
MSVSTLDLPVKDAAVQPVSIGRRIKNNIATVLFVVSFVSALVPLVWLLWVVFQRGWYAITQPGWSRHSLRGVLP